MRIVIDARYLRSEYTGIGTYSARFLEALAKTGSEHEFVVLVHESFGGRLNLGSQFEIVEHAAPPVSLATVMSLGAVVRRHDPHLLHSTFPLSPMDWKGPLVATFHDLQPMLDPDFHGARPLYQRVAYGAFYRWAYRQTLSRALYVLCDSHYTRRAVQAWQPAFAGKCHTVHLGAGAESFDRPDPGVAARVAAEREIPGRYVLYLGSTRPNKNLVRMLDGFLRYKAAHPEDPVKWLMVVRPDRFFEPVLSRLRREGLLGEVRIIEQVTETEKRVLLSRAEALYFATLHEGFGLPVLEAQALGTPVVVSTEGSLPEVAGRAAVVVDGYDAQSMAAGLEQVLHDNDLRARLAIEGPENAQRYSWTAHAREVLAVYDHLVEPLLDERTAYQLPEPLVQ